MLRRAVWQILTDVSEELTASIIRAMMEAERCNIPKDSHLHTHRRDNLKYHPQ
jgi:hypothetical protein